MKSRRSRVILVIVILLVVLGTAFYVYLHRGEESTDDAAIDGRVVTLSPKISGYVKTLNINDNQFVHRGDVLLEIDPTDYINKRDQIAAALEAALAGARVSQSDRETTDIQAPSNLDAAEAQVESAEANWQKAVADLKRMTRLNSEARSQEQLDQAVATEKGMKSSLENARANLRSAETAPKAMAAAEATSDQLLAKVKQAQADLAEAEKDLADTKILAPADGYITRRGVERGDYVQPGQDLGALVGTDVWVTANFKETQLTDMHPGQHVTITVDAFPSLSLDGTVDSIQAGTGSRFSAFPPENATGNFVKIVQRVPVKILFKLPDDKNIVLAPGMSVVPTVQTLDADNDNHNNDGAAKDKGAN